MKKTAILSILLCLCMVASLVLVPAPQAAAAVDTSKLEGVYEAVWGDLMYTITFDNGKMTIVDAPAAANFPLAGEYTYTVERGTPIVESEKFVLNVDRGGNMSIQPNGMMMPIPLTKVAELGATQDKPAIDKTKLDGVYEVVMDTLMYTLTFDNGKLTIVDAPAAQMRPLGGEYTYTVDEDGIPTVEGASFMFSKDMGGNYTIQGPGMMFPVTMTKVAELGGNADSANTITVETTDTFAWVDEFFFTAEKAGDYTFTVPAGLGVFDADKYDDPATASTSAYIDFQKDNDGGEFTITLAAGQKIRFYANAGEKKVWTITWRLEAPILSGTIDARTTENNCYIDEVTFLAPEDGDYTFTLPAGLGAVDADKWDQEDFSVVYADYYENKTGKKFTVTLKKGQVLRLYIGAQVKDTDWVIEWTTAKKGEEPKENVVVVGENTITITDAIINEGGVAYTFTVEVAGNYTFALGTLRILIVDASGMTMNANSAYLVPGTYTLRIIMNDTITAGDHILTITTDAAISNGNTLVMGENTIEYGDECIATGKDYTFVVTEDGTYRFEGLLATIKDANGMYLGRNESPLAPGTYIITLYNSEEAAGTFTVTVTLLTEEILEQEAIDQVIDLISAIGEVTADSKDAIETARAFYNALSDESKAKITNLDVLVAAEEAYAALTTPDEPGDEPGTEEPTTPPTTQPTTPPTTQPSGNNNTDGDKNDPSPVVIIVIVVVVAVVVVAVILFSKKKKA